MTLKTQMAADMISTFLETDDFAETVTYTTPAGVVSTGIKAVIAYDTFIQEYEGFAGRSASVVCSKAAIASTEIHGYCTATTGEVLVIQQIGNSDSAAHTLICLSDKRISPGNMR